MTASEAQAYFREKGLTYADVTLGDLHYLRELLDEQFIRQRKELMLTRRKPLYWKRVNESKQYKGTFDPGTGILICAYMTGRGEYFTDREVISFYPDGEIGFCSSADRENKAPVLAAFAQWCDWLAGKCEMVPAEEMEGM